MAQISSLIEPAPTIDDEAQRQKTALLFRGARTALVVNVINAFLVVLVNGSQATAAWGWWAVVVAVSVARCQLTRTFFRADRSAADAMMWRRRYIGATAIVAAAWAAGAVLFMWDSPDGARLFTGLVLCGMVAGAVPLLGSVPAAFRTYSLIVGVPTCAIALLQADSMLRWAFGCAAIVFLAAMLRSASILHRRFDASIRLGLEKIQLLENLDGARRAAEAALKASVDSEQRYRTLFENAPLGIAMTTFEGAVLAANESMFRMFGFGPGERPPTMAGMDMRRLYADPARRDQWLQMLLQTGSVHGYEAQFRRRDGTQFFGSLSVDQVRQDSGVFLLVMLEDITQRHAWREKIYHQAHYDALTDLPNRRLMLDRVNQAMDDARRRQRWAAVLFLDLDCFKQVNDSLGHDVGDRLLKEVAARLKAVVRRGDTICRHGGDEFVVVLTDLDHPQDASTIAVKILEALRLPIAVDQNRLTATTSIGIGVYPDGSTPDANALVKKADAAMYAAKQDGGNRYCCRDDAVEGLPV